MSALRSDLAKLYRFFTGFHFFGGKVFSRRPGLGLFAQLFGGNFFHGRDELHGTGFALNLATQRAHERIELPGGHVLHVAGGQLGFSPDELLTEPLNPRGGGLKKLLAQGFSLDGALILDFKLELAAPGDERWFGDAEFFDQAFKTKRRSTCASCIMVNRPFYS